MHLDKMAMSVLFRVYCRNKLRLSLSLKDVPSILSTRRCSTQARLVETERVGHVYLVGINRPEVRNCVNRATAHQLHEAFTKFEQNEQLWVAVLYGKGGCFCSGYDLKEGFTADGSDLDSIDPKKMRPMGPTGMAFSKPVIAAVNGFAVAGGLELALMCDMRFVEESATLGVFCRRWGVPLLDGGTVRLQKLIGLSRALDMTLTGRPVQGEEAHTMGLANRLCTTGTEALSVLLDELQHDRSNQPQHSPPTYSVAQTEKPGNVVGEATKLAQMLCLFPQASLRADRKSAYNAAFDAATMEDALNYEWEVGKPVAQQEACEGAARFQDGAGRHGSFDMRHPTSQKQ